MNAANDEPDIRVDVDAALREAMKKKWRLEFELEGRPYVWTGKARTQAEADRLARGELEVTGQGFDIELARLVACVEV